MVKESHRIRIKTHHWRPALTLKQLQSIVDQINTKAQDRRMLGQISGAGDQRMCMSSASHIVLPTAKIRGSSIAVDIELIDSGAGRTVKALRRSGVLVKGVLRGVLGAKDDVRVSGVDVDLSPEAEDSVLDDLVDALEEEDQTST